MRKNCTPTPGCAEFPQATPLSPVICDSWGILFLKYEIFAIHYCTGLFLTVKKGTPKSRISQITGMKNLAPIDLAGQ